LRVSQISQKFFTALYDDAVIITAIVAAAAAVAAVATVPDAAIAIIFAFTDCFLKFF
jgi:hypothetical protein